MQKEEYLIKNACYSVTKYYLCKQNNKRSLLGRKQRSQVARSFLNRYQFSCINKITSLFSDRYIFIIILHRKIAVIATSEHRCCFMLEFFFTTKDCFSLLNKRQKYMSFVVCNRYKTPFFFFPIRI